MSAALAVEAEDYLGWLSNERGRAPRTVASYRADLGGFAAWLEARGTDLLGASSADIAAYLAHLRDDLGRAASTAARAAVSLRGLYRFLVAEDLASTDPAGALDDILDLARRRLCAVARDAYRRYLGRALDASVYTVPARRLPGLDLDWERRNVLDEMRASDADAELFRGVVEGGR